MIVSEEDHHDYIYGEDNTVCYFISHMEEGIRRLVLNYLYETPLMSIRFEPTELYIFHIGDIVEVQILVVATPGRDGSHKMKTILRSIALINGRSSQVNDLNHVYLTIFTGGFEKQMAAGIQPACSAPAFVLKHKVSYGDDEERPRKISMVSRVMHAVMKAKPVVEDENHAMAIN